MCFSNWKIYLSKLVWERRHAGRWRMTISKGYHWPYLSQNVFVEMVKCVCPYCKMYLSKLLNVFVKIAKCICQSWFGKEGTLDGGGWQSAKAIIDLISLKMYLSKWSNVFVHIARCICLNCWMYLSKLQNVFVKVGLGKKARWKVADDNQQRLSVTLPLFVQIVKYICPYC